MALGFADGQQAPGQVDIRARQPDGLADPQPGGRQQPKDGPARHRPEPAVGRQAMGRRQEFPQFVLGEDVRHPAAMRRAEQAGWVRRS